MFKQIIPTMCVAALLSAGSVAYAVTAETVDTPTETAETNTSDNNQEQGSLSNQANVSNNSNSNTGNVTGAGAVYTETNDNHSTYNSESTNTSTNIANQNGYVASIPIIASAGTCLGSVGTNISAAGIGLGGSKTVVDEACNARQDLQLASNIAAQEQVTRGNQIRLLNELGLQPAALSLMCQDADIRKALKVGLEPVVYDKVCAVYDEELVSFKLPSLY